MNTVLNTPLPNTPLLPGIRELYDFEIDLVAGGKVDLKRVFAVAVAGAVMGAMTGSLAGGPGIVTGAIGGALIGAAGDLVLQGFGY